MKNLIITIAKVIGHLALLCVLMFVTGAVVSGVLGLLNPNEQQKCPPKRAEIIANWITLEDFRQKDKGGAGDYATYKVETKGKIGSMEFMSFKSDSYIYTFATTSPQHPGMVQDGYTTDTEAIEFNKRVEQCRTFNGEF